MKQIIMALCMIMTSFFLIQAAPPAPSHNTQPSLIIQKQLSDQELRTIVDFFKKHEEEIKNLLTLKGFVVWKKNFAESNTMLAKAGLENEAIKNENYSIPIPHTEFILEVSGPGNRWQNTVQHFGKMAESDRYTYAISLGNDVKANKEKLKNFRNQIEKEYTEKPVATYQAISRIYLGNALQKRIQEKNLKNIKQPQRFLVKYPWAPANAPVTDANYAVVEDHIPGARHIVDKKYLETLQKEGMPSKTINEHFVDIKEISPLLIPQILEAFKAGLWNFNAMFKNGDIYFANTEQPNSANPELIERGFDSKDPFWQNRINGSFRALIGMIKNSGTPAQLEAVKKYVETDEETKKLPFYNTITALFANS